MAAKAFWDFAVALYERPGVARACITLQDELRLDVNVILFCLWLADGGHDLGPVLDRTLDISRHWQAVIVPLRDSRRALKALPNGDETVRQRLKDRELDAERCEIAALAELATAGYVPDGHARVAAPYEVAASNLRQYFSVMNSLSDPLGRDDVLRILAAAFEPTADAAPISSAL